MQTAAAPVKTCPLCSQPAAYDEIMDYYYCNHCDAVIPWLPDDHSLILSGPPGVGKTPEFNYWSSFYLRNLRPVIWLAFDDFPSNARKSFESYCPQYQDYEKSGFLTYVDCHSSVAGVPSEEEHFLKGRVDFNELSLLLTELLAEKTKLGHPKVVLDSVTPMFTYREPQVVVQFLAGISAKLKAKGAGLLISITTGTVEDTVMKRLETIMDFSMEMRFVEEGGRRKRQARFAKARGIRVYDEWIPIYIGSQAVSVDVGDDPVKYERLKKMLYGNLP